MLFDSSHKHKLAATMLLCCGETDGTSVKARPVSEAMLCHMHHETHKLLFVAAMPMHRFALKVAADNS